MNALGVGLRDYRPDSAKPVLARAPPSRERSASLPTPTLTGAARRPSSAHTSKLQFIQVTQARNIGESAQTRRSNLHKFDHEVSADRERSDHLHNTGKLKARHHVPYWEQGNLKFANAEAKAAREATKAAAAEGFRAVCALLWQSAGLEPDQPMNKKRYVTIHLLICAAIAPKLSPKSAEKAALADWVHDAGSANAETISFNRYCAAMLDLADHWTDSTELSDYQHFMEILFIRITKQAPRAPGDPNISSAAHPARTLRAADGVTGITAEQLRKDSKASAEAKATMAGLRPEPGAWRQDVMAAASGGEGASSARRKSAGAEAAAKMAEAASILSAFASLRSRAAEEADWRRQMDAARQADAAARLGGAAAGAGAGALGGAGSANDRVGVGGRLAEKLRPSTQALATMSGLKVNAEWQGAMAALRAQTRAIHPTMRFVAERAAAERRAALLAAGGEGGGWGLTAGGGGGWGAGASGAGAGGGVTRAAGAGDGANAGAREGEASGGSGVAAAASGEGGAGSAGGVDGAGGSPGAGAHASGTQDDADAGAAASAAGGAGGRGMAAAPHGSPPAHGDSASPSGSAGKARRIDAYVARGAFSGPAGMRAEAAMAGSAAAGCSDGAAAAGAGGGGVEGGGVQGWDDGAGAEVYAHAGGGKTAGQGAAGSGSASGSRRGSTGGGSRRGSLQYGAGAEGVPPPPIPQRLLHVQTRMRLAATRTPGGHGRLFARADKDGKGSLDTAEFYEFVRRQLRLSAQHLTDEEIRGLMGYLDKDRSGLVSIAELREFIDEDRNNAAFVVRGVYKPSAPLSRPLSTGAGGMASHALLRPGSTSPLAQWMRPRTATALAAAWPRRASAPGLPMAAGGNFRPSHTY